MGKFEARIARNSRLLQRLATKKFNLEKSVESGIRVQELVL